MRGQSIHQALLITFFLAGASSRLGAQTPEIIPLAPPQLWQRAEFRVDRAPVAANCFDPDQIRLDVTFTAPSGASLTVPAFWYQGYSRALAKGAEVLTPIGAPHWRIRFTPVEPGDYRMSLSIQVNGAPDGTPLVTHFNVPATPPSGQHGYVRIAPDKRYFETSDGRSLHLVGHNVCWAEGQGTFDYDAWFGGMRNAGENFARLWLAPWFMGLEHNPGTLNHYDLKGSWQLDYIFREAERSGIYLLLCFDHHGMFQADNRNWGGSNNFWPTNAYNQINGGPCAKPNDFFTNDKAKALYQKRLRYLVGRYGDSPYLLAWQFFNEIDNVYGPLKSDDVLAWHREMGQWLRAHDPYHHLVTTSLTGGSERPEVWALPELDFAVYHSYGEAAPGRGAASIAQSFVKRYGKPAMIGEFGIDARSWNIASDPYLRGFRQALWGGALGGSVGTAMSWWWQDMHSDDVYPLFAAMNDILRSAGLREGEWKPVEFVSTGGPPKELEGPLPGGQPFDAQLPLNSSWRLQSKMQDQVAVADPLAAARSSETVSGYLRGTKDPELKRPIKIIAFFGDKAKFTARVTSAVPEAELVVRVDGHEAFRRKLGGTQTTPPSRARDINQGFTIEVAPGKRVIEIGNEGYDWILVNSLKLEQALPAAFPGGWTFSPDAVGLHNEKSAVLYVCSPNVVFPAGALRYNPPIQNGRSVELAGWPAGRFSARWFDPSTGKGVGVTEGVTEGSKLTLPLPAFRDDLAAIVAPAAGDAP